MSTAVMILGESGTGKTTALRHFSGDEALLIQVIKKPLPFKADGWSRFDKDNPKGNIFVSDNWQDVIKLMTKTRRKVIVIDDFQYLMANEFMRRSDERGFDKFTDIGKHAWEIFNAANQLPDDVRVYLLSHTQKDEQGHVKFKTIGKMLDEKITVEGLFTIVLRTTVDGRDHYFSTHNNGQDTVKSPLGLFDDDRIPNDLAAVDKAICEYYGIGKVQPAE